MSFCAALLSVAGCAADPSVLDEPDGSISTLNHNVGSSQDPGLIRFQEMEEHMVVNEGRLRVIRMKMAGLSEEDLSNPEIVLIFQREKDEVEQSLFSYYCFCKRDSLFIIPQLPDADQMIEDLEPLRDNPGAYYSRISDLIFDYETYQRLLRVAIYGRFEGKDIDQQSLMDMRQGASDSFPESERNLQFLYGLIESGLSQ